MQARWIGALLGAALLCTPAFAVEYFPPKGDGWATRTPAQAKLNPAKLKAAIDFAISAERKYPPELAKKVDIRDLRVSIPLKYAGNNEAYNTPIGPLKAHAPANGIIIKGGYIVAEWGKTREVDMTFSVTKTFVSSVAGVAFDRGMIKSVNDRVIDYVRPTPDYMHGAQPARDLERHAAPAVRLDRHAVGQALVGGSSRTRQAVERAGQGAAAGGQGMEIQ
jgi:CubicO group peptidase (beta-lactamase class C family)